MFFRLSFINNKSKLHVTLKFPREISMLKMTLVFYLKLKPDFQLEKALECLGYSHEISK